MLPLPRRLNVVNERLQRGYFRDSLNELRKVYDASNASDQVLMAELLLRTESSDRAQTIATQVLKSTSIPIPLQAKASLLLGIALGRVNRLSDAIKALERAIHLAAKSDQHQLLCLGQIHLLIAKFDLFGPASLGTLPGDTWLSVQSSGDPTLLAQLHCRLAALEGLRGALDLARRHAELAESRLRDVDNPHIESLVCNLIGNLALLTADPKSAIAFAKRALESARRAGDHFNEIGALANLCQMSIIVGALDDAREYLTSVEPLVNDNSLVRLSLWDDRAQLQLLAGDLAGCELSLEALASLCGGNDLSKRAYTALETVTTQVRLLERQGRPNEALKLAREALEAAFNRGATPLVVRFGLQCADILVDLGQFEQAVRAVGDAIKAASDLSVNALAIHAEVQRVRGRVLGARGAREAAIRHFDRAIRINAAISHSIAEAHAVETKAALACATVSSTDGGAGEQDPPVVTSGVQWSGLQGLEAAASLFVVASRPDLLGIEAFELLADSGLMSQLLLVATENSTTHTIREYTGAEAPSQERSHTTAIALGQFGQREYRLEITSTGDLSSQSCVAAMEGLLRAAVACEEARREKLERNSVVPVASDIDQDGPLFSSPRMRSVYRQARKVAAADVTILLTGETGVGKEVLAREIHRLSPQSRGQFQPLVCAGVPSNVLESQLFGYKKGSFTGAVADFQGVIRGAAGGTLFLDEIGDLPIELQVKLLRFLDSKEIHPLGEARSFTVDVRIIAATNANLQQLVDERKFREDLFYRLNVATFNIPPLRERREEIPSLMQHFLLQCCQRNHKSMLVFSDEATEHLLLHHWPGNVRELRNEMERLAGMLDAGATIRPSDLKPQIITGRTRSKTIVSTSGPNEIVLRADQSLAAATQQLEREMIKRTLYDAPRSLDEAARILGITRKGLYSKRQRLGLL
jgi:DNA-binding NtrC family response regulator/tetratricopeptide (TPR) repeat protein